MWSRRKWLAAAAFCGGWYAGRTQAETAAARRVFELRIYTTLEGRLPALQKRFREHTTRLFAKHGMTNIVYLTPVGEDNKLVYLLAHESQEAAEKSWNAFRNDPEWQQVRTESEQDGKIVAKIEQSFLTPTDYSPMK